MDNDSESNNSDLLSDLERLQEALTKRQLDPNFPPLILERVDMDGLDTVYVPLTDDSDRGDGDTASDSVSWHTDNDAPAMVTDDGGLPLVEDVATKSPTAADPAPALDPTPISTNPFLSSKALETLIAKRNAAEASASRNVQSPVPQAGLSKTAVAKTHQRHEPSDDALAQILAELPGMIEAAVAHYIPIIESDVRRKIEQRAESLNDKYQNKSPDTK